MPDIIFAGNNFAGYIFVGHSFAGHDGFSGKITCTPKLPLLPSLEIHVFFQIFFIFSWISTDINRDLMDYFEFQNNLFSILYIFFYCLQLYRYSHQIPRRKFSDVSQVWKLFTAFNLLLLNLFVLVKYDIKPKLQQITNLTNE